MMALIITHESFIRKHSIESTEQYDNHHLLQQLYSRVTPDSDMVDKTRVQSLVYVLISVVEWLH